MNLRQKKLSAKRSNWQTSALATAAAVAAAAALWGTPVARGDVLVNSFEGTGFDFAGDTGSGVVYETSATTGVTDGSFSLHVSAPQSWWINFGLLDINPTALAGNSVLQFDVTTSTGVSFVPVFHNDPTLPADPGGGGWNQDPNGHNVGSSPNTQTIAVDYSQFNSGAGLPAGSTYTLQFQGSTGNAVDFYIDNVRLTGAIPTLDDADAQWALDGSGNWVNAANWNSTFPGPGAIPGAPGSQIVFGTNGGAITTPNQIVVTTTQAVAAGRVTFDKGGGGYKIAGNFGFSVSLSLTVNSGNHEIANPLTMSSGSTVDVAAGSSLKTDNLVVNGYGGFTKNGAGTFTTNKIENCTFTLNGGTAELLAGNAQNGGFIFGLNLANSSTFKMNGANIRNNSLSGDATTTVDLGNGGVLRTALYNGGYFSGVITGAGQFQVGDPTETSDTSANTFTVAGNNDYTGGTRVTNGRTLVVETTGNIGTGSLTVDAVSVVPDGGGGFVPASVNVVAGRTNALKVAALELASTGTIDLNDNDLVVGSVTPMATIETLVKNARNGGAWNQPGLTSTTAKTNASANTNLGVIRGAEYTSFGGTGTFSGQTYAAGDTLVKYTWNGDTNFSGTVNFDDYVRVDIGFNTNLTGWSNGDFNYSGGVNFDDYVMIDVAFNTQSGTLGRAVAYISGDDRSNVGLDSPSVQKVLEHFDRFGSAYGAAFLAAVPEPTAIALIGVPALAGMIRRRRRLN